MNKKKPFFPLSGRLPTAVLISAALAAQVAQASTLWTGPTTNYNETVVGADDVLIPGKVSFARNSNGPLYNKAAGEGGSNFSTSPTDTEWAFGQLTNFQTLTYQSFAAIRSVHTGPGGLNAAIINQPMVVHLVSEDIYLSIQFTSWPHTAGGHFTYTRSTPAAGGVVPTVTITSPTTGSAFIAPASIGLTANASATGGTVTNVQYFAGTTSLGSAGTSPFSVTGHISTPGAYALTAVATAAGVSATSAIVNITVLAAPTVSITNPVAGAVFAAPANVQVDASASVTGGSVTNVMFFNGTTQLGSVVSAPFSLTASNLTAGSYSLTAVAIADSGSSATSSVVSITVVAPVAVTESSPQAKNGQFTFSYSANSGLTYVVFRSPDLINWTPVSTNKATANPVAFSDALTANSTLYYRVARLPNP